MPRSRKLDKKPRHDPLYTQLDKDETEVKHGRISQPGKRKKTHKTDDDDSGDVILDPKTSRRIFELARDQQDDLEMPDDACDGDKSAFTTLRPPVDEDDNEESDIDLDSEREVEEEELNPKKIDEEDLHTLGALLPENSYERRTLADIIFSKLDNTAGKATAAIQKVQQDRERPDPALGLNPTVVEAYRKRVSIGIYRGSILIKISTKRLGLFLQKYKSGPLPKLFKVIPSLPAWARMLALTSPESWSPHACRAATRIFISNMRPPQAQLFLSVVLLDAIREDIDQNKKLNVQYYEALKRALYKPGAFFKGIIFPMLDQGCTLKQVAIIASILSRTKIPVLHASAALLRIADMDYSGPNSLFIRVLIDKKFELPYQVVDALVFHFIRLSNTYKAKSRGDCDKLPVLWHQSLLVFCQRYASDLTPDQKDALLDVIRATPHPEIGLEIRRELVNSVVRGAPRTQPDGDIMMA